MLLLQTRLWLTATNTSSPPNQVPTIFVVSFSAAVLCQTTQQWLVQGTLASPGIPPPKPIATGALQLASVQRTEDPLTEKTS